MRDAVTRERQESSELLIVVRCICPRRWRLQEPGHLYASLRVIIARRSARSGVNNLQVADSKTFRRGRFWLLICVMDNNFFKKFPSYGSSSLRRSARILEAPRRS